MISQQITKKDFALAMEELGHDPKRFQGKKINLVDMAKIYNYKIPYLLDEIEQKTLEAHYDYVSDKIWIDAFDAAFFYYCDQSENYK